MAIFRSVCVVLTRVFRATIFHRDIELSPVVGADGVKQVGSDLVDELLRELSSANLHHMLYVSRVGPQINHERTQPIEAFREIVNQSHGCLGWNQVNSVAEANNLVNDHVRGLSVLQAVRKEIQPDQLLKMHVRNMLPLVQEDFTCMVTHRNVCTLLQCVLAKVHGVEVGEEECWIFVCEDGGVVI